MLIAETQLFIDVQHIGILSTTIFGLYTDDIPPLLKPITYKPQALNLTLTLTLTPTLNNELYLSIFTGLSPQTITKP